MNPLSYSSKSRRQFLGTTVGATSLNILSGFVKGKGTRANGKLNLAFVGAGGRAKDNIEGCAKTGQQVYALCDVDSVRAGASFRNYSQAKRYTDWREMLEAENDSIDAVVISTPDHLHAVSTMAAIRKGKHVYVEKPLTHTISEARALHEAAKQAGVCTQMGNIWHASESPRYTAEYIQSGSIGDVEKVYCRTNRPIWPQDLVRPAARKAPSTLDWDLWLGPAAEKPYSSQIAPFKWRGFLEYGTGALGDMGAHILDHPMWALDLGLPSKIVVEKADRNVRGAAEDSHPSSCIINFTFPAKDGRGPVELQWLDGRYKIPRNNGLRSDRSVTENGCLYLGSKHQLMHSIYGEKPRIVDRNYRRFVAPPKTIERSPGHYQEWIDAIKAGDPTLAKSNFDESVPLTELLLLGVIASIMGEGAELEWDAEHLSTGDEVADRLVHHQYRDGWSL